MGTILIGMSFFEKYSVNLDIKNHLVHFPNHMMSMQVRQQKNNRLKNGLINLCSSTRPVIPPLHPSSDDTGPQRRGHLTYNWHS